MHYIKSAPQATQKGVVLLEALIAVMIFSMGILAIAGLQVSMLKNTTESKVRSDASFLAQQQLGLMWSDPTSLSSFVVDDEDISDLLPNGKKTVSLPAANGEVKIEITWNLPGEATHNYTTYARIVSGD